MKRMIWNGEQMVEVEDGRPERRASGRWILRCVPGSECLRARMEEMGRAVGPCGSEGVGECGPVKPVQVEMPFAQ